MQQRNRRAAARGVRLTPPALRLLRRRQVRAARATPLGRAPRSVRLTPPAWRLLRRRQARAARATPSGRAPRSVRLTPQYGSSHCHSASHFGAVRVAVIRTLGAHVRGNSTWSLNRALPESGAPHLGSANYNCTGGNCPPANPFPTLRRREIADLPGGQGFPQLATQRGGRSPPSLVR